MTRCGGSAPVALRSCRDSLDDVMTFCILPQQTDDDGTTLRLEGWLTADTAWALLRACQEARRPVRLDLGFLINADPRGVETLRHLQGDGVRFENPSPYLALLLGLPDVSP